MRTNEINSSNQGRVEQTLKILNKGERGWWFGIPGALTAIAGLGELCGSVYHFAHAVVITAFTGKSESKQYGSALEHTQIAGGLALRGLAHIMEGVVGLVPFIGPEVARYVAKEKGWGLSERDVKPQVHFMGITTYRNQDGKIEEARAPKDIPALKWLNKQAGKCWVIPGAIMVLIGLGEVLAAVGKFVWPLGVMACSGFSKVASGKHGEAVLHWKIARSLLMRGLDIMNLGAELMIPHLGKLKSREILSAGPDFWIDMKLLKDPNVSKFLGLEVKYQDGKRVFTNKTPGTEALLSVMNKGARGWGFGIPGAATTSLGIVEALAGLFEMVVKPAQILVKSAIAQQWKGDPIGHFMIGYTLFFRGLANAVIGLFEMLPFIGPNIARAIANRKGWRDDDMVQNVINVDDRIFVKEIYTQKPEQISQEPMPTERDSFSNVNQQSLKVDNQEENTQIVLKQNEETFVNTKPSRTLAHHGGKFLQKCKNGIIKGKFVSDRIKEELNSDEQKLAKSTLQEMTQEQRSQFVEIAKQNSNLNQDELFALLQGLANENVGEDLTEELDKIKIN